MSHQYDTVSRAVAQLPGNSTALESFDSSSDLPLAVALLPLAISIAIIGAVLFLAHFATKSLVRAEVISASLNDASLIAGVTLMGLAGMGVPFVAIIITAWSEVGQA